MWVYSTEKSVLCDTKTAYFRTNYSYHVLNGSGNKDHLQIKTALFWSLGWSYDTGFTVSMRVHTLFLPSLRLINVLTIEIYYQAHTHKKKDKKVK